MIPYLYQHFIVVACTGGSFASNKYGKVKAAGALPQTTLGEHITLPQNPSPLVNNPLYAVRLKYRFLHRHTPELITESQLQANDLFRYTHFGLGTNERPRPSTFVSAQTTTCSEL